MLRLPGGFLGRQVFYYWVMLGIETVNH